MQLAADAAFITGATEAASKAYVECEASPLLAGLTARLEDRLGEDTAVALPPSSLRLLLYGAHGFMLPHSDRKSFVAGQHTTTSLVVYLGAGLGGADDDDGGSDAPPAALAAGVGCTVFLNERDEDVAAVEPALGAALLFPHPLRHRGDSVGDAGKLILRAELLLTSKAGAVGAAGAAAAAAGAAAAAAAAAGCGTAPPPQTAAEK